MEDDYDDDIADEDLVEALTQSAFGDSFTSTSLAAGPNKSNTAASFGNIVNHELDDLPTDAFSSSPEPTRPVTARQVATRAPLGPATGALGNLRQTTLFGDSIDTPSEAQVPSGLGRAYRGDKPDAPTQHTLDLDALKTWVYPENLGAIRDYQYSIVKNGLFNNTLVALPTGLGKTFIAATVMLNYYRWTKDSKIIFVAPTKPLVAQQVDACFNIVGIARSDTTMLTGECAPALRAEEWQSKRVFFMTPQTLLNDISRGYADPKSIVLLVIDEAHRATGEYAYAKVTKLIRRFNPYFRLLALTATPGSKIETVQEVMDNLGISHTEIRTEDSMDIRQYVHARNIDQRLLDPSDEMCEIKTLFTKALKPLMDKLTQQNIYYGRDPMSITTYGLMQQEKDWYNSIGRSRPQPLQNMMRAIFAILKSLAHSVKLLNFHGIKPFYDNIKEFRAEVEAKGGKASKYKQQITSDASFQEMMDRIDSWLRIPDFVGHPKLAELANTIMNHFIDAETRGGATRAIVFSEYRDSAEEIVRALNIHKPMINATVFVGQADSKRSAGMKQSEQIETIEQFKNGKFNVLVATSIGEEGLDIGQVDLIICYDASSSPIRMLQRMGRTGRKREGHVVLLLMNGKEADNFARARDNYEQMQKSICEGSRFNFRHDLSPRIVPRHIVPQVDKQFIHIPIENTQNTSLPEPGKRRAAPKNKKVPPKKFHMPDGVITGFMKASDLGKPAAGAKRGRPKQKEAPVQPPQPAEMDEIAEVPPIEAVFLSTRQTDELNRTYRSLPVSNGDALVEPPSLTIHPRLQRVLRPIGKVKHGKQTKRFVKLMQALADGYRDPSKCWTYPYGERDTSRWKDIPAPIYASESDDVAPGAEGTVSQYADASDAETPELRPPPKKKRKSTGPGPRRAVFALSGAEGDSHQPVRTKKPKAPKKPARKKPAPKKRGGINSDEVGDDCERDSDAFSTDGSDNGSDLEGFVNDGPISSPPASTLPSSAAPSPMPVRRKVITTSRAHPVLISSQLSSTQQSLDELPDIDELMGGKARGGTGSRLAVIDESEDGPSEVEQDDDEEEMAPRKFGRRLGKRSVVLENSGSDSDE